MKNVSGIFLFTILFYSGINGCKSGSIVNTPKCDSILNLDTPFFKKENIFITAGRINPTYTYTQEHVSGASLKAYDKGYDSIAIRVFYDYSGPVSDIIEIRKHCKGWVAQFIEIKRHTVDDKLIVEKVNEKFISPQSGWENFTKSIFNLGIDSLPDCFDIVGYHPSNDGHRVIVEISKAKNYRIYEYINPITKPHSKEAKKMEEIMIFIEKEFGIKRKAEI